MRFRPTTSARAPSRSSSSSSPGRSPACASSSSDLAADDARCWVQWFREAVQPGDAIVTLFVTDLDHDTLVAGATRFAGARGRARPGLRLRLSRPPLINEEIQGFVVGADLRELLGQSQQSSSQPTPLCGGRSSDVEDADGHGAPGCAPSPNRSMPPQRSLTTGSATRGFGQETVYRAIQAPMSNRSWPGHVS
jgi:hypothetical protein